MWPLPAQDIGFEDAGPYHAFFTNPGALQHACLSTPLDDRNGRDWYAQQVWKFQGNQRRVPAECSGAFYLQGNKDTLESRVVAADGGYLPQVLSFQSHSKGSHWSPVTSP